MTVFYLTCLVLGLIIVGAVATNIYERVVERRPFVRHKAKEDESWKDYQRR